MLVFEAKLEGEKQQYERLDEAIRTARFIRNSCIRYWGEFQLIWSIGRGLSVYLINSWYAPKPSVLEQFYCCINHDMQPIHKSLRSHVFFL